MRRGLRQALALACVLVAGDVAASSLNVVGLFPGKAVVAIDKAAPRSMAVGETVAGIKLLAVDRDSATFLVNGRRQTVPMGSFVAGTSASGRATAVLDVDGRGHYMAAGTINGVATRFIVDTGATLVVLSAAEATRLGIVFRQAPQGTANTANGAVPFRLVRLDRIKVGDVELTNVEAGVMEGSYDGPPLLGMSFLSRTEVSRDGQSMVLTKRF